MVADAVRAPVVSAKGSVGTTQRLAGVGGLVFVALVILQNLLRASGPTFAATPTTVATYFADHRAAALIPLGLFPLEMVALFAFTAGIWSQARDSESRWWATVGTLAVVAIAGLFSLVNLVEIVIVANGTQLVTSPEVVRSLWMFHSGAFGLDLGAVALALVGLSRAARMAGLIPRWLAAISLPGAACLFVAAIFTVSIVNGGQWLYLGLVGFAVWGVFLVVAGVSLIRGGSIDSGWSAT